MSFATRVLTESTLSQYVDEYHRTRFTQIPHMIGDPHIRELTETMSQLVDESEQIVVGHQAAENSREITGGSRYLRFDPGHPQADPAQREIQLELLNQSNLAKLGERIATALTPVVGAVLGDHAEFCRCYFLAYRPGDYISAHDDKQTGNRINVQIPIPHECRSCIRILDENSRLMEVKEDIAGQLRFLGPAVWHDVPPFVADSHSMRYNFMLRYRYGRS
ncbi:hypothetical protein [Nocardia sp. NPDC019395]|uniref:hypothetical protein n=1 Tax=Nocardia sp. NPDC019395 TaxID=3154686 RepID=UPI0033E5F6EB